MESHSTQKGEEIRGRPIAEGRAKTMVLRVTRLALDSLSAADLSLQRLSYLRLLCPLCLYGPAAEMRVRSEGRTGKRRNASDPL